MNPSERIDHLIAGLTDCQIAIHAQSERVRNPTEVLAGLNSILCGNLGGLLISNALIVPLVLSGKA